MNVLLTGNAGYIGTVLTTKLLDLGHKVVGVDWGIFGLRPLEPNFTQICADTRDLDLSYFEGMDAVIDLAAISNDPAGELYPDLTWSINWAARRQNVQLAAEAGVKRYILASTCSVYGKTDPGVVVKEGSPVNPQTVYAQAAVKAEEAVLEQAGEMIVTVVRQGTVYGYSPRMRWDLVLNAFVRRLFFDGFVTVHGDGSQWRPLLYIEDTAKVMAHLLEIEDRKVRGEIFNVVGENTYIGCLAQDLASHFGGTVEYKPGESDTRSYQADGTKLKWTLLRHPGYHILDAAEKLWEWLEAQEVVERPTPSHLDIYRKHFAAGVK